MKYLMHFNVNKNTEYVSVLYGCYSVQMLYLITMTHSFYEYSVILSPFVEFKVIFSFL